MKKIFISLITFTVGVFAFNLLHAKKAVNLELVSVQSKAVEISAPKIVATEKKEIVDASEKSENLKPFFDSFDVANYDDNEYQGRSAWFMINDFKGMKEVWTIMLNRSNENSKDEKLVWSAMVLTQNADGSANDEDNFQSVWIKTESNRLSFKTNKIRGIEYQFDGTFFKNGKKFSNDEKVLRGTMQKFVKGKLVAKFTADFAYNEPHCFH